MQVLLPPLVVIITSELSVAAGCFLDLTSFSSFSCLVLPRGSLPSSKLCGLQVYLSSSRLCCQRTCWVALLPASSSGRKVGREGGKNEANPEERLCGTLVMITGSLSQSCGTSPCFLSEENSPALGLKPFCTEAGWGQARVKIKLILSPGCCFHCDIHIPAGLFSEVRPEQLISEQLRTDTHGFSKYRRWKMDFFFSPNKMGTNLTE